MARVAVNEAAGVPEHTLQNPTARLPARGRCAGSGRVCTAARFVSSWSESQQRPWGEDRAGARCGSFEASVSPTRTPEPDVRVPTHPALCEFVSLGYATVASARVHGVGICLPR